MTSMGSSRLMPAFTKRISRVPNGPFTVAAKTRWRGGIGGNRDAM